MLTTLVFLTSLRCLADVPCADLPAWPRAITHATKSLLSVHQAKGVKIAVLDSGIDPHHPAFRGIEIVGQNFTSGNTHPTIPYFDNEGHGNHVSGIIVGSDCRGNRIGLAPQSKLYAARVCNERGCASNAIASGIDWAISQNVDVINLSIEGDSLATSSLEIAAVRRALAAGISVVTITGNGGDNAQDNSIGNIEGVITVGAVNQWGERPFFSQTGLQTLAAPGVNILSAVNQHTGLYLKARIAKITSLEHVFELVPVLGTPQLAYPLSQTHFDFLGYGGHANYDRDVRGKLVVTEQGGDIDLDTKIEIAEQNGASALIILMRRPFFTSGLKTYRTTKIPTFLGVLDDRADLVAAASEQHRLNLQSVPSSYDFQSGTSMAAPFVTATIAILKSINKDLTPIEIRDLLVRSASHPDQNRSPLEDSPLGAGIVNVEAAINAALKSRGSFK